MKKRSISETVLLLCCNAQEFLKGDGSLNVTHAAKCIGLNQPTLKRIIDGESKTPNEETREKLCSYFKVTIDQLFGANLRRGFIVTKIFKKIYAWVLL